MSDNDVTTTKENNFRLKKKVLFFEKKQIAIFLL